MGLLGFLHFELFGHLHSPFVRFTAYFLQFLFFVGLGRWENNRDHLVGLDVHCTLHTLEGCWLWLANLVNKNIFFFVVEEVVLVPSSV